MLSVVFLVLGGGMILRLESLLEVPEGLAADVKLLFLIVLIRYLLTILRTAFDTSAFIVERLDLVERRQSIAYLMQAILLITLCRNRNGCGFCLHACGKPENVPEINAGS